MKTIHCTIDGLTCEACVNLVTRRIKKVPGVQHVNIQFRTGDAEITGLETLDIQQIQQSLVDTTYQAQ